MSQTLKIFLASSEELKDDREKFDQFIGSKNKMLNEKGQFINVQRWEDFIDAMSQTRLQDEYNRTARECDIFVMLFATKVGPYTREEFEAAFGQFQETKKPLIYTYFKKFSGNLDDISLDDFTSLKEFQNRLKELGHFWTRYADTAELINHFNGQLEKLDPFAKIPHSTKTEQTASTKTTAPHRVQTDPEALSALRQGYLRHVFRCTEPLQLSGIDRQSAQQKESCLELQAVYTALLTQTAEEHEKWQRGLEMRQEPARDSALEQLNRHRHLVLLGDPGSGKSTFVNFVALCLAGEFLEHAEVNLKRLTTPVPQEEMDKEKPQRWDHGPLLPVRIILRDFAARGLPPPGTKTTAEHLWQFVADELKSEGLGDFAEDLRIELLKKGGLVLIDGLDEVPEASQRRVQIKQAVESLAAVYAHCRILVTSRTYAYQNQDWRLSRFQETVLAPFSKSQIQRFIDRWYAYVARMRHLDLKDAQGRAELLKQAIFKSERLPALAERPLLLTLMASLHAWRGGSLPEQREELYSDTVDLLLDWWESPKIVRDQNSQIILQQPSLAEWLKVDKKAVRDFLNETAFQVHLTQPDLTGTADVAENDLVTGLLDLNPNPGPEMKPKRLIEFLSDRAGLLLPRGEKVYTFPHRTFQEYLAACYLTDTEYPDKLVELVQQEPVRWREVALLAGAKAVRGTASSIWLLVDALCPQEPPPPQPKAEQLWGPYLAGQALVETTDLSKISSRYQPKVNGLKQWLLAAMTCPEFPAIERAVAGVNLAHLDDPRDEVLTVDQMQFCLVPAGPFQMGGEADDYEKPVHLNEHLTNDFWMSRFPVTNSQFREFIEEDGYANAAYWPEAIKEKIWKNGKIHLSWAEETRQAPKDFGKPFNLSNHPVVGITWYEALAFTRWLSEKYRQSGSLSKTGSFRLPTEAEWEKAARGGLRIPVEWVRKPLVDLIVKNKVTLQENSLPQREYPWGDEMDKNNLNFVETKIGATSAVGCFPEGVSPYGCEEMSGNVWERTLSLWGKDWFKPDFKYPYQPNDGRETLDSDPGSRRVVRGGCWFSGAQNCRSAGRGDDSPEARGGRIGFRLVFVP